MKNIIDQNRTYNGLIVGYKKMGMKTNSKGETYVTNPMAFIWPREESLRMMAILYRIQKEIGENAINLANTQMEKTPSSASKVDILKRIYSNLAERPIKNPENIAVVIPLPGQGERHWTKGNAYLTEQDFGKNVSFTVTEPDKQGLLQAINVTIINPEETLDEDLRQEAAEEARLELAELAQTAPVTVVPVAMAKDVAVQNGVAALATDEIEEDPLDYDDAEEDDYYGGYEKPARQKKSKRLDKKSHKKEWDE